MKKFLILLLAVSLSWSCIEDKSAYLPQDKEEVSVDPPSGDTGGDPVLGPGELRPGVSEVTLDVTLTSGEVVKRRFKYYLPASIDPARPISLIFEFHGSWEYEDGEPVPDPIAGIRENHTLNALASRENCITIFPAGDVDVENTVVNWAGDGYLRSLPFVDAMLEYMSSKTPRYDEDRVYTTGQSSGGIFSYVLAFYRSEVFAASLPRSGQMSLDGMAQFPATVVPIRAFNGVLDQTVVYATGALPNITKWAEKVAGYYSANSIDLDTVAVEGYIIDGATCEMARRVWRGGSADIELFSLIQEGHGIAITRLLDYMWEFMSTHVRNRAAPPALYMNASVNGIALEEGQSATFNISYSSDAEFTYNIPADWNPRVDEGTKTIGITAPNDFFTTEHREGNFTLTATRGSDTKEFRIPFKLVAPKAYFEVGDIYYVNFVPVGVVVWVNNKNIKEAKIASLKLPDGNFADIYYNGSAAGNRLGPDFETPSRTDGAGNTAAMMAKNPTLPTPNTARNSLWVSCASLSPEGTSGWYLPAIDELAEIYPNFARINAALTSVSAPALSAANYYSSTVKISASAGQKDYYYVNFRDGSIGVNTPAATNPEYMGYIYGRAFKVVTK